LDNEQLVVMDLPVFEIEYIWIVEEDVLT